MNAFAPRRLRDRLGEQLRHGRLAVEVELLTVLLILWLSASGALWVRTPTIPLLLMGWFSLWLRGSGWKHLGMSRPRHWPRTIVLGGVIGIVYQLLSIVAIEPALHRLTGDTIELNELTLLRGNPTLLLLGLALSWSLAAFGEEMAYRGYLLNRLADLFGRRKGGWIVSIIVSSSLFALAHSYQGMTGVAATLLSGAVLCGLFLLTGRNLWLSVIAHGVIDTVGVVLVFLGLYP